MFFNPRNKNLGSSIVENWESKKPAPPEEGETEAKEAAHKDSLKEMGKDLLQAVESKSPGVLASALESFIEKCLTHSKKD